MPRTIISAGDRAEQMLRRWRRRDDARDHCGWRGISEIRQGLGLDRDATRGILIKLVARGSVEVGEFSNGIFWRAGDSPSEVRRAA